MNIKLKDYPSYVCNLMNEFIRIMYAIMQSASVLVHSTTCVLCAVAFVVKKKRREKDNESGKERDKKREEKKVKKERQRSVLSLQRIPIINKTFPIQS